MSSVMHAFHSGKMAGFNDSPVPVGGTPPVATLQACYQCHPGATTQCLRGAMTDSVTCQNCHGNMAAVGGKFPLLAGGSIDGTNDGGFRRPWLDLPRCSSCHANDATLKTSVAGAPPLAADGLRFIDAFGVRERPRTPRTRARTGNTAGLHGDPRRTSRHGPCSLQRGTTLMRGASLPRR